MVAPADPRAAARIRFVSLRYSLALGAEYASYRARSALDNVAVKPTPTPAHYDSHIVSQAAHCNVDSDARPCRGHSGATARALTCRVGPTHCDAAPGIRVQRPASSTSSTSPSRATTTEHARALAQERCPQVDCATGLSQRPPVSRRSIALTAAPALNWPQRGNKTQRAALYDPTPRRTTMHHRGTKTSGALGDQHSLNTALLFNPGLV